MRLLILGLMVMITGCTQLTTASLPSQPVTQDYVLRAFVWDSNDRMHVAFKTFEEQGKVGLCGAYAEKSTQSPYVDQLNSQALAAAQILFAGETLIRGIDFFTRGGFVDDAHPNASASCVLTDVPWEAAFKFVEPEVRWGKTYFRVVD
ncbi:MAG: hypothetical protein AAGD13_03820 [Pseudomonadota bacterium]